MAKLAKKINKNRIEEILKKYDSGETPADLATEYGVHPTTIRRYLRNSGRNLSRVSHKTKIDPEIKNELRRVLKDHDIKNIDILISDLDKHFILEKRQGERDSAFEIIHL